MYVYQLCIYIQSSECIAEAVPLQVLYPTKFFHVALGLVKSKRQSWFRQRSYTTRFTEKNDQAVPNDLPLYSRIGLRSQQLRQRPSKDLWWPYWNLIIRLIRPKYFKTSVVKISTPNLLGNPHLILHPKRKMEYISMRNALMSDT